MIDPKLRFSDRVSDYKKYRPSYSAEVISFILENCPVDENWKIADIGSGTGISSRLLSWGLKCPIYAVEPNDRMREAAESDGKDNPFFHSIKGSAEATTLETASMNLVCAFQSFHWFDRQNARIEFSRILKEPKWALFVWNDRITNESGFLEAYEKLLLQITEYKMVNHNLITLDDLQSFTGDSRIRQMRLLKKEVLNREQLQGRFSSSSYTPKPGSPEYTEVMRKLKGLFDRYNRGGVIEYKYNTDLFLGKMS